MKKTITLALSFILIFCCAYAKDSKKEAQLKDIIQAVDVSGIQLIYTHGNKQDIYNLGTIANDSDKKVTSQTVFEAASLSKCVFTYAVLRLYDRGIIDLDKPLLSYLGQYNRFTPNDNRYAKITARMVLRHTTGLPNWGDEKEAKLMFTPDSCFSYSGEGFVLLQKTMEKITGKSLNQIAREEVFDPLKMESSNYQWIDKFDSISAFGNSEAEVKRHSVQNAAYSLLTNAHDYNIFLQAILSGKDLKPATHSMMFEKATGANWFNHKVTEATAHISWGLGVGLQQNEKGKAVWHWGDNGGFKAFYISFPAKHESIVYFVHNNRGLFIAPEVIDLFLGKQSSWAIKWIEEGYDSPYAIKAFRESLTVRGFDHAADVMNSLKQTDPAISFSEGDINEFGFILLQQKKLNEAVEIFKLNIANNPSSANAYDSLAEAYEKAGNKQLAIQNFKRCVELNPKNEYAVGQLKKLESNTEN